MSDQTIDAKRGLMERLNEGTVICAEGYLFELERRGYVQAGAFVPEAVLEYPEAVMTLHREFMRAGSDVVEAFTYYGHREKLRLIGKEDKLEALQRDALTIAKRVASEAPGLGIETPLVAGNICNTNVWNPSDRATDDEVRRMFEEQVNWAVEAGVDFIIGETFNFYGEARIALETIKAANLPAVITLTLHKQETFRDDVDVEVAFQKLEQAGADVVGLNCAMGPQTILPYMERIRRAVSCHVAALPVPYRTTSEQPTFQSLQDPTCDCIPGDRPFPTALDPFICNRYELAEFGQQAVAMDIRYLGICCGSGPHHIRSLAEALGRRTPASQYSPDMSKHYALGSDPTLKKMNQQFVEKL
ncbi:MAG TPA: homocysteine S-methyltransferase family protein [candidate division Zixibacteria bacterium]|nr:homocysteine S-methyltransferase family protein [candidate division Zixibacteria bacterium]